MITKKLEDRIILKVRGKSNEFKGYSNDELKELIEKGMKLLSKYGDDLSYELTSGLSDKELKAYNVALLYKIFDD